MRTSLNEIELIDRHLLNQLSGEESALFNARLLLDPGMPERIAWQKRTRTIVEQYSRKKLKAEIEAVHERLFNRQEHMGFRQKVLNLFK